MTSTRVAAVVAIAMLNLASAPVGAAEPPAAEAISLGLRGVYFVENQGQWGDEEVIYGLRSRGLDVAFRESSFTMHLSRPIDDATDASRGKGSAPPRINSFNDDDLPIDEIRGVEDSAPAYEHLTLTISFPGSNLVTPCGAQPQTAKFNYFVGGQGRGIASNVPSFGAVIYEDLYDGIDLLVCGNDDGVMKYEFHCEPGADYAQIRIHYDGIDSLCVNAEGDLEIATSFGTLRDGAPLVWQEGSASRGRGSAPPRIADTSYDDSTSRAREEAVFDVVRDAPLPDGRGSSDQSIPARFELIDDHTYRIILESAVDPVRPLFIDPEIEWMLYLGGSDWDRALGTAVDDAGDSYVAGWTYSSDFAGRNNFHHGGSVDTFALKVSQEGELQWMTYLGGREEDHGLGMTVDNASRVLVTGATRSWDFVGRTNSFPGGEDSAFVVAISPTGELQWMTYFGGSRSDRGYGVAVDSAGNVLVGGYTWSTNFTGRRNSHFGNVDAFALKVNESGQLQWMNYLGGSGWDYGSGIGVHHDDSMHVVGDTTSTDFSGRNNSHYGGADAFAVMVSPSGQIEWMTYLGGADSEQGLAVSADSNGNALVSGETRSTDFSGAFNSHHGGEYDAFVLKLSPVGEQVWMTYLGGGASDYGLAVTVDRESNVMVTGTTASTDFVGRNNSHHGGDLDAFVLTTNGSGQVQWMTYFGGSGEDVGYGITPDDLGNALVAGTTKSADFAGRSNSYYGGREDAFLMKLGLEPGPRLSVAATCPSGGPIQIEWSGASPGGQVALIFARNTGSFIIPNNHACAGTQLGLGSNQIQLAWQGGAGQNGSRTLNTTAGPGACGGYLQLLDLTTCATSNVARIE